jgi:hypothetical protein
MGMRKRLKTSSKSGGVHGVGGGQVSMARIPSGFRVLTDCVVFKHAGDKDVIRRRTYWGQSDPPCGEDFRLVCSRSDQDNPGPCSTQEEPSSPPPRR